MSPTLKLDPEKLSPESTSTRSASGTLGMASAATRDNVLEARCSSAVPMPARPALIVHPATTRVPTTTATPVIAGRRRGWRSPADQSHQDPEGDQHARGADDAGREHEVRVGEPDDASDRQDGDADACQHGQRGTATRSDPRPATLRPRHRPRGTARSGRESLAGPPRRGTSVRGTRATAPAPRARGTRRGLRSRTPWSGDR